MRLSQMVYLQKITFRLVQGIKNERKCPFLSRSIRASRPACLAPPLSHMSLPGRAERGGIRPQDDS